MLNYSDTQTSIMDINSNIMTYKFEVEAKAKVENLVTRMKV